MDFGLDARRVYRISRPSFLTGVARIFDFGGFLNEHIEETLSDAEADYDALLQDWTAVGDDIRYAIQQHDASLPAEQRQLKSNLS